MTVHCFQHVAFEDPGCITDWASAKGVSITYTRFYLGEAIPEPQSFDALLVMGGPMGVDDENTLPWLVAEKKAIKQAIEADKPVLGICLGAQLIAQVLGAAVTPNPEKEIGWFALQYTEPDTVQCLFGDALTNTPTVFHWHGDTFSLPPGAKHLARSEACDNQAFLYNERVLGVQYHLEVTPASVEGMIAAGLHDIKPSNYVQPASSLTAQNQHFAANNQRMFHLLDALFLG